MLEIQLKPSSAAFVVWAGFCLTTLMAIASLQISMFWCLLLALFASGFLSRYLWRDVLLRGSQSDLSLRLYKGVGRRFSQSTWQSAGAVRNISQVLPVLLIVDLESQRPLLIWRDAVSAQHWRALKRMCRLQSAQR